MRNFRIIIVSIALLFFGCTKPIEFGSGFEDAGNKDVVKTKIGSVLHDPSSFEGKQLLLEGKLKFEEDTPFISNDDGVLAIAPVGYEIPDSLAGGKIVCLGFLFYHEEREAPGIAANAVKIFPPR